MKYNIVFRCKESGHFPEDYNRDEPMNLEEGESALIPDVGDEVTCLRGERPTTFTVLSRHFTYIDHTCKVDIAVGPPKSPKPLNLKE